MVVSIKQKSSSVKNKVIQHKLALGIVVHESGGF
jgi:hypothetical protein